MSALTRNRRAGATVKQLNGLVTTCFATIVILLIEYGLGMWVNFYSSLPSADNGAGTFTAVGRAIANGPVELSIHAVTGLILILSALTGISRAASVRRTFLLVLSVLGLAAVLIAAAAGAHFVGHPSSTSSMLMAIMAGVSILIYALMLFLAAMALGRSRA